MSFSLEDSYEEIVSNILSLCHIPSPTGFTARAEQFIKDKIGELGYSPLSTNKNAIIVELGGEGEPLLLSAHLDTLGAMVRAVKSNGRLRITKIGGYPERNLEGVNCTIHTYSGKEYSGTFQPVSPATHVNLELAKEVRDDSNIEVVIDEKISCKDDVGALGIMSGNFISIDPGTVKTSTGFIKSRHLDDKASCALLIGLAKYLKENGTALKRKVYLMFSNHEEVGHGASASIPEDVVEMIAVDMGAIGDDLETDEHKVSICAKDSSGPYNYEITKKLVELAEKEGLNYAVDIYPYYGSDAGAALRAGHDIRTALIGPGVSASHGYERAHREGLENSFKLLLAYLEN